MMSNERSSIQDLVDLLTRYYILYCQTFRQKIIQCTEFTKVERFTCARREAT